MAEERKRRGLVLIKAEGWGVKGQLCDLIVVSSGF